MTSAAARASAVAACIFVPWLNPLAGGPSAMMQPWMLAAAATLLLWAVVVPQVSRRRLLLVLAMALLLTAIGKAAPPVLLAVGGLGMVAITAVIGHSAASRPWLLSGIANAWLLAAVASCAIALTQYFGWSTHVGTWINPTEPGEAFGNLRQRNQFATLTSIGLASLAWKIQQGLSLRWTVPAAVLLAVANAASSSRTGALQLFLVALLCLIWVQVQRRQVLTACAVAVVAYVVAALALPLAVEQSWGVSAPNAFRRLASPDGCSSRAVLWGNVLHLIAQKPWWGWGWGELDYAHFATLYPGARFCDILDNAHNLPLHLAVELGVPVALLACGGFLYWVVRQRPWSESDARRQLAWTVLAVILLHSMLEYPLWYGPFQMAFGLALGLLWSRPNKPEQENVGRAGQRIVAALLALVLLVAAVDYHRISQLYAEPADRSDFYRNLSLPRAGDSWLFRDQVAFAELSVTELTRENAGKVNALALELLHYSPEPRVIDSALQSAMWLGREDMALWLLARYKAAFPREARNSLDTLGATKPRAP